MPRFLYCLAAATLFVLPIHSGPTYPVGRIQAPLGEIHLYLFPETPHHRDSFINLAGEH